MRFSFWRRKRRNEEFNEEIQAHLTLAEREEMESGQTRKEAQLAARREFGNVSMAAEVTRDVWGWSWLGDLVLDVKYGLRMLRKSPGFTLVAVLTLALGIGANNMIFSLLDGLLLRDLPVPHPQQIVRVATHEPDGSDSGLSLPMFEEIARDQDVFSGMFAWEGEGVVNVETDGSFSRPDVWPIDGNFYSELGTMPEIGRLIGPQDVDVNSSTPTLVAVLGYDFWRQHYDGDRGVIGKTIKIEGIPFTIIGVTRKGFRGMTVDMPFQVAVPLTAEPLIFGDKDVQKHLQRRDVLFLDGAGRLKPGVTLEQARAQLDSLWPAIRAATMPINPTPEQRRRFLALRLMVVSASTGGSYIRGRFSTPLYVLLGISSLVLLIACVNLASLMLSRAAARSHEMGVRVALGASRRRLAQQMLTESLMLSIAGTLAGFALASWGSKILADFILRQLYIVPAALNLKPDLRILGFTAGAAILTGVLCGLAPAWCAFGEDPNGALQQCARNIGRGTGNLGKGLIVTQVALSLVLLTGAAFFVRSLEKLHDVQPGFRTRGVLNADLFPKPEGYKNPEPVTYYHELTDRVSSLPGVESAGIAHIEMGSLFEWKEKVRIRGTNTESAQTDLEMVMPGFFPTMNIGLIRGRDFTRQDDASAPRVAIVSENFAQKMFPGGDEIGQHIDFTTESKWENLEIVGIVSNASLYDIRKHQPPTVYLPSMQYGDLMGWSQLLVHVKARPEEMTDAIRRTVESLGREYVPSIHLVEQDIDRSILQERVTALLSGFFGGLALLLAAIGLYGLTAYSVTQRTREIGIRMALGAQQNMVLRMVLRETLVLVLIGTAIGLPCAFAATRLIAHMLFGLSPEDPATVALVTGALLIVAAAAGYLPARRAMRVDPMVALRYE